MVLEKKIVSRKYARAFYAVYEQKLTDDVVERIQKVIPILRQHHAVLTYIQLGLIAEPEAKQRLKQLVTQWDLLEELVNLTGLLYDESRLSILPDVLDEIVAYYYNVHNTLRMHFESDQPLTHEQVELFSRFLSEKTGKNIKHTEHINKDLIAGVRLIGSSILWEHNIARQLKNIRSSVMKKS